MPDADGLRTAQLEALLDVLARHTRGGERPEDMLVDFGLVSDREVAVEVAMRTGLPFRGLRGHRPDPELFAYVPMAAAVEAHICPLAIEGDVLSIASAWADPDLSAITERFPNLKLELSIAPRTEILEAIARGTSGA